MPATQRLEHTLIPMRYVLRADASPSIGAGHVMRSSAIAEELIARGENVVFVGQISGLPWVEERIATLGFTHIYNESSGFFSNPKSDVLLLDSYEIDKDDTFVIPERWLHVVAIVDEKSPNYHCKLRIHPGLDSDWTGDSTTPILAGAKYIPLRTSLSRNTYTFSQIQHRTKIAVVAGGSDPYGLVFEIAKMLMSFSEEFDVHLFSNSTLDFALDNRFQLYGIGHHLDTLTNDADLVLTTASTSSLEFLARGLCVGIACAIDNQKQCYRILGELGVAAQIGFRTIDNDWKLDKDQIYSLIASSNVRFNLLEKAKGLIDFKGASRIVDAITNL